MPRLKTVRPRVLISCKSRTRRPSETAQDLHLLLGIFQSVRNLQSAIDEFLAMWQTNPEPFILTACLDCILREIGRWRGQYAQLQPGRLDPVGLPKKVMVAECFFVVEETIARLPTCHEYA